MTDSHIDCSVSVHMCHPIARRLNGWPRNCILIVVSLWLGSSLALANDVHIAQAAAGAANGADCAHALAYTHFNNPANWTSATPGGTQIGPGTTVHLCGTFTGAVNTTMLTFQGSGTSGHPITVYLEPGVVFTSPAWGENGAIDLNEKSYVILDGGSNSLIENTANGTDLANSMASKGVSGGSSTGSNVEVKNLRVQNIYVRKSGSSDYHGGSTQGIALWNARSNISVHNNTSTHANINIGVTTNGADSNWNVYGNATAGATWGILVAVGRTTDALFNVNVYSNKVSNGTNWTDPRDEYHNDGIFLFGQGNAGPGAGGSINKVEFYNNYIYGSFAQDTAFAYFSSSIYNVDIFNNVFAPAVGSGSTNGLLYLAYGTPNFRIFNNSFIGTGNGSEGTGSGIGFDACCGATNTTFENNIEIGMTTPVYAVEKAVSFQALDYNFYWHDYGKGSAGTWCDVNTIYCTNAWSTWHGGGEDTHGNYADPELNASFVPAAGSPVRGAGTNLNSLCEGQPIPGLGALCYDALGNRRPASGNWDPGAFSAAAAPVQPPGTPANSH